MRTAVALGFSATEVQSAMTGLGIHQAKDPYVFGYVIEMGNHAAKALNAKKK